MKRLFLTLCVLAAVGVGSLSVTTSVLAQDKMRKMPAGKKDTRAANVYVCKACKSYFPAAAAKKMGYKDPMGHKLVHKDKAPVGYMDGSKMKMGDKSGKM